MWNCKPDFVQKLAILRLTHLCRHSLVVMVCVSMSRQMGQVSSDLSDCADTAISVWSVMASCGVRCSSYRLRSHDRSAGSSDVIVAARRQPVP